MIGIRRATEDHLSGLTLLLEEYRVQSGSRPNPRASRSFLKERLKREDSVIFICTVKGEMAGFVQLFAKPSTLELKEYFTISDLFVLEQFSQSGVLAALLNEAQTHCMFEEGGGLFIETEKSAGLGELFIEFGWKPDPQHVCYLWPNPVR